MGQGMSLTDGQRFSGQPPARANPRSETADLKPSTTIQLRKEFALEKQIKRAVVFVCGLGHTSFASTAEGGRPVLDPGWTNYGRPASTRPRCDRQLAARRNALGVMLGNGMYNVRAAVT